MNHTLYVTPERDRHRSGGTTGCVSATLRALAVSVCALTLVASPALASASTHHKQESTSHRVGGKVHRAWPRSGGKPPRSALARWLARQVGPTKVLPCTKRVHGKAIKCRRAKARRDGTPLSGGQLGGIEPQVASTSGGVLSLGEDTNPIAFAASSGSSPSTISTGQANLQLDRSYQIPTDDPSYVRLLNWSWTYDSAISALGLTTSGSPSVGEEILDQLAALQRTDGSIEIAFNVADGTTEPVFRSGTIATMGLAGAVYDQSQHTDRYLAMEQRAASYLIALQGSNGLIRGGPDVGWYSTQHNLLAYAFLNHLGAELIADNQRSTADGYLNVARKISSGIESKLLVHNGPQAWFIEGLGDHVQSLDADALGVLYLVSRDETTVAQEVLAYAQTAFALSGRSITKSTDTATYNNTYAAPGPFSGFKPFLGTNAPDVMWTEGSAEMELADAALGQPTSARNASLPSIYALSPTVAPLMVDRTLTDRNYSAEFHVWPADAAGAWFLLAQKRPTLFPNGS